MAISPKLAACIQHRALRYYQGCSNDDPRVTFEGKLWFVITLSGKIIKWWITQKLLKAIM